MNLTEHSLSFASQFFDNAVLAWALLACGIAQFLKLFFELIRFKKLRPSVLIETGGMPSSHSALVTGTASGVGWELGFNHPGFAIAATLAFVVMYDASGIRRSSGLIAERVNLLPKDIWPDKPDKLLKESLGHTRIEVLVGSFIGPLVALPGLAFVGSPLHFAQTIGLNIG